MLILPSPYVVRRLSMPATTMALVSEKRLKERSEDLASVSPRTSAGSKTPPARSASGKPFTSRSSRTVSNGPFFAS